MNDGKVTSDDLERAHEFLFKHRWTRNVLWDTRENAYCAVGAYLQSKYGTTEINDSNCLWPKEHNLLAEAMGLGRTVTLWNDRDAKDKQEVLDKFMEGAKKLRNEGK